MKTVKKYATFGELKSNEKKTLDARLSLKKHDEFEKIIKEIKTTKTSKNL